MDFRVNRVRALPMSKSFFFGEICLFEIDGLIRRNESKEVRRRIVIDGQHPILAYSLLIVSRNITT